MSYLTQTKRLIPGVGGEPASANAYFALTGLTGVVGWGGTAYIRHFVVGDKTVALMGWAGIVVAAWLLLTGARMYSGVSRVEAGVMFSLPGLIWIAVTVLAFAANGVGLVVENATMADKLMCMPWVIAFALGYLLTGLIVTRGWVYLAAGVVCAAVSGLAISGNPPPAPLLFLGAAHSVPMFVDAAMGGRQLNDEGIPVVKARRMDADQSESTGGIQQV